MLVTTGAAAVVTPQPYQPPVIAQPDVISQPYQPPVVTQPPATTTVPAQTAGWNTTAVDKRGKNGQRFTYTCSPNGAPATVWGTNVYTDDSSICTAAVSAGLITFQAGGSVTIEIRQGQSSYTGSTRNGVTSKGYGSWNGSFVFVGPIPLPISLLLRHRWINQTLSIIRLIKVTGLIYVLHGEATVKSLLPRNSVRRWVMQRQNRGI